MASVRDFTLDDQLFPGSPGDSLLYTDKEIAELWKWGYQVSHYRANEDDSAPKCPDKIDPTPNDGDSSKTVGTPDRKHAQCPPSTLTWPGSEGNDHSKAKLQECREGKCKRE